jgi:Rrf2 family cysteine metabolism transcriptional repressor
MRITSKGEYGLHAVFHLAEHYGADPVTSHEIAAEQQIPEAYLNQLLLLLRKGGLVRSVRGPRGGHKLAQPPEHITLAQVIRVLEGGCSPVATLAEPLAADASVEAKVVHGVWTEVEQTLTEMLESITLEDLCQRKLARQNRLMYHI